MTGSRMRGKAAAFLMPSLLALAGDVTCAALASASGAIEFANVSGKVQGVGTGKDNGNVRISGRFTLPGPVPLDRATLTLTDLLDETRRGGAGAGGPGGADFLPITLPARAGSKPMAAIYQTPSGTRPSVRVEIRSRDPQSGQMEFSITVDRATIARPAQCAGGSTGLARLVTRFRLQAGFARVRVGGIMPWQCRDAELRTP